MVGVSVPAPPFQREHAARLAKAIQQYDRRLDIHWDFRRERWRIMEWIEGWKRWTHCFYWEGADKQFRPLPETADTLLHKLRECDWSSYKDRDLTTVCDTVQREMDGARLEWLAARKKRHSEVGHEYGSDLGARTRGVRQTFGPGPLRSRKFVQKGSRNIESYWAEARKNESVRAGVRPQ